jgi:hypothetical protein
MDSRANAWAWRRKLSPAEQEDVIRRTADVASRFYSDDELAVIPSRNRRIAAQ